MDKLVFYYSENEIAMKTKRLYLMLLIIGSVMTPLMTFNFMRAAIPVNIIVFSMVGTVIISFVIVFFTSLFLTREFRKTTIELLENSIRRMNRSIVEEVKYVDITRLQAVRSKDNKIQSITIRSKNKLIVIAGFEDMETMLDTLTQNMPDSIPNEAKTRKGNPDSFVNNFLGIMLGLFIYIVFIILAGFVPVLLGIHKTNLANKVSNSIIPLIIGVYFLVARPVSRSRGIKFAKFELLVGALLLLVTIAQLVLIFLT